MVFHSLDKITSLFIHVTPSLGNHRNTNLISAVVWALKWHSQDGGPFNTCSDEAFTAKDYFVNPLLGHIVWQALYFIKVQVMDVYKFKVQIQSQIIN